MADVVYNAGMAAPRRIVSLVPSTTETVCALGAGNRLVGVTRYCTEPAALLAAVPCIGGTKNPSRQEVMARMPDLVLGNAEENRAEDLLWFGARVPLLVQTPRSVSDAAECILELAQRLDCTAAAGPLLADLEDARLLAAAARARAGQQPLRVFYAIWRKPWMGASAETYIHDVLTSCGAHNVCAGMPDRYPRVEPAELVEQGLDLVLLASEPWPFSAMEREEIEAAGVFGTAAIRLCDGRDFCWHGAHSGPGLRRALALLERCMLPASGTDRLAARAARET